MDVYPNRGSIAFNRLRGPLRTDQVGMRLLPTSDRRRSQETPGKGWGTTIRHLNFVRHAATTFDSCGTVSRNLAWPLPWIAQMPFIFVSGFSLQCCCNSTGQSRCWYNQRGTPLLLYMREVGTMTMWQSGVFTGKPSTFWPRMGHFRRSCTIKIRREFFSQKSHFWALVFLPQNFAPSGEGWPKSFCPGARPGGLMTGVRDQRLWCYLQFKPIESKIMRDLARAELSLLSDYTLC